MSLGWDCVQGKGCVPGKDKPGFFQYKQYCETATKGCGFTYVCSADKQCTKTALEPGQTAITEVECKAACERKWKCEGFLPNNSAITSTRCVTAGGWEDPKTLFDSVEACKEVCGIQNAPGDMKYTYGGAFHTVVDWGNAKTQKSFVCNKQTGACEQVGKVQACMKTCTTLKCIEECKNKDPATCASNCAATDEACKAECRKVVSWEECRANNSECAQDACPPLGSGLPGSAASCPAPPCGCWGDGPDKCTTTKMPPGQCTCKDGWRGYGCNIPICAPECQTGTGTCTQTATANACVCAPGWTGESCATPTCTKPHLCGAHGTCVSPNTCACATNWGGKNCSTCTSACNNHGTCSNEDGSCTCDYGWEGGQCESCDNSCNFHGTCSNSTGKCVCNNRFKGADCDTCSSACGGRGTCSDADGSCACAAGFGGADCETCTATCSGHGKCSNKDNTCTCDSGFKGNDCATCSSMCSGHGTCSNTDGSCACEPGFGGKDCDTCTATCSGHGTCSNENGKCTCAPGFAGEDCEKCTATCNNHGSCSGIDGSCMCNPGFGGKDCSVCTNACSGHGACNSQDGACACEPGWTGKNCETAICPAGCQNGGACTAPGVCSCSSAYGGAQCEIPLCSPACENGACSSPNTCTCPASYTGALCDTPVCALGCQNGGKCSAIQPNTCVCRPGWTGPQCEQRACAGLACENSGGACQADSYKVPDGMHPTAMGCFKSCFKPPTPPENRWACSQSVAAQWDFDQMKYVFGEGEGYESQTQCKQK